MRSLAVIAVVIGAVPLTLGLASSGDVLLPDVPDDPFALTGIDYVQLSPAEREAYVAGFIAGAAIIQASAAKGDTGQVAARLDALRESRKLRFPFGTGVYATVLREYFTSPETARQRIVHAMVIVHEHLAAGRGEM